MDITYHDFMWGGWIHILSSVLMIIAVVRFVIIAWEDRDTVSVSDVIGILSWIALSVFPVVNFSLTIGVGFKF